MIRQDFHRIDAKRRSNLDPKKKQFAQPIFQHHEYQHRLNFYTLPPTAEITLEEFEEWAINRLKGKRGDPSSAICCIGRGHQNLD